MLRWLITDTNNLDHFVMVMSATFLSSKLLFSPLLLMNVLDS